MTTGEIQALGFVETHQGTFEKCFSHEPFFAIHVVTNWAFCIDATLPNSVTDVFDIYSPDFNIRGGLPCIYPNPDIEARRLPGGYLLPYLVKRIELVEGRKIQVTQTVYSTEREAVEAIIKAVSL